MSKAVKTKIRTSETNLVEILVTTQRIKKDINGNPKYLFQVWILREDGTSNIWCPAKVWGIKANKMYGYTLTTHSLDETIQLFITYFEKAVRV